MQNVIYIIPGNKKYDISFLVLLLVAFENNLFASILLFRIADWRLRKTLNAVYLHLLGPKLNCMFEIEISLPYCKHSGLD